MSKSYDATCSLKVMINKEKTKVLFAEADSVFMDMLLSFLTLPLGMIVKVLDNHYGDEAPSVGSLSNLYRSVANFDDTLFVNQTAKLMLLNPRSSFADVCPNLEFNISRTQHTKYFTCDSSECCRAVRARNVCMYYGSGSCDSCGRPLLTEISVGDRQYGEGLVGFTIDPAFFVIYDDLRVEPNSTGFLQTVRDFDINGAELMNVTLGFEEVIGLLKCCLLSETPLTDLILNEKQKPSSMVTQSNTKIALKNEQNECDNSKDIILKITVQKSTNKLLFAQADAGFVDLLFSFLTIPLGRAGSLSDSYTGSKNVDNLYRSLVAIDDKYFKSSALKSRLLNPDLAYGYGLRNELLSLSEETAPQLYSTPSYGQLYYNNIRRQSNYDFNVYNAILVSLKSPIGSNGYVKEPVTYMVTDDLTVTPFSLTSAIGILDFLKIPVCDVDELEVHIGLAEVLGILKASLTTTSALSSALINHLLMKFPKLESMH